MDIFTLYIHIFVDWLLYTTCQASLIICLVLLLQRILHNQLSIRARYLMWLVVVVRMALPWAPESRLSMYNLLPYKPLQDYKALMGPTAEGGASYLKIRDKIDATIVHETAGTNSAIRTTLFKEHRSTDCIIFCVALSWLTGVCFLTVWILAGNIRIMRIVRCTRPATDSELLELLEDCRKQIGTHRSISIIVTDQVYGPGLFGFLQPCLLLPERILADMNRNELRYIFLHELAHLKRHDIPLGMVASILHVLHWFNPIVGYGFRRMRADQEIACDGLALSRLNTHETSAYGHTVLNLIEQLLSSRSRFALTGFLGNRARLTQRIAMISRFTKETYRYSPLAIVLVGLIGYIGLTNGYTEERPMLAQPKVIKPTESRAPMENSIREYANVKRIYIRHIETGQYLIASGNGVDCDSEPGEAGLWEARFDGEFGPNGDMLIFSVANAKFLTTDGQENVGLSLIPHQKGTHWIRHANALGVQVISRDFSMHYLRLDEEGRVVTPRFGRDLRSQWDIVQLDIEKETKDNINK